MEVTQASPSTKRSAELFYGEVTLRGSLVQQDAYFEIGNGVKLGADSYIDIYYTYSRLLLKEWSSLTVLLNDIPLETVALDGAADSKQRLRIDLSKLALGPGYHKLTLKGSMKLSNNYCEDPLNEALWLRVLAESTASLNFVPRYAAYDLSHYPSPFIERGLETTMQAILVVPDNISQSSFSAAASLAQFVVQQSPDSKVAIPVYTESDAVAGKLPASSHSIWIGEPGQWGSAGTELLAAAAKVSASVSADAKHAITILASPWNGGKTAMLVSGDAEQLAEAATILTSQQLYRQLRGRVLPLPQQFTLPAEAQELTVDERYTITLQEMGYSDLKIENAIEGATQFQYIIPADRDITDGAQLQLAYSHSDAIDHNKSMLTVTVNGTPVKSITLSESANAEEVLDVFIPPAAIDVNRTLNIDIKVQFANDGSGETVGGELRCQDNNLGNWAVISKHTTLSFIPTGRKTANLQSLPYPFANAAAWEPTTLVAPVLGTRELQLALGLIGQIGASLPDVSALQLVQDLSGEWQQEAKNRHVIFIGTQASMPEAFNGYDTSYVAFAGDKMNSQTPEVQLLDPLAHNYAALQLTRSPLNQERYLLLAAAATPERLQDLRTAIADGEQSGQLSGRLVALDAEGEMFNFPETEDVVAASPISQPTVNERWQDFTISGIAFAIILLLALIAVFAGYWLLRKRGD
ncbi:hypothetical protein PA598K_05290 [Paenibacillus sp. 598K]|nr:hypothetical protein PA598K_05290 [Paenibacillus sp. 598K]